MLFHTVWALVCIAFAQVGVAKDPLANTKHYYKKGGPDDSRSPCPGLNALANHGYIPRNGKRVNLIQLVAGALQGLGVSPEVSGFVGAVGFASSRRPLTLAFDLEDLSRPGLLIEHDCSFSREDHRIGNNNDFNRTLWNVALREFKHKPRTTSLDLGRAKSARIQDAKKRNPRSACGPRAAAFGAIEVGMVISVLGAIRPPDTAWVRSLWEQERIPTHLGWKLSPLSNNAIFALAQGAGSLLADPKILTHAGQVVISTPRDLLSTLTGLFGQGGKGEASNDKKKGSKDYKDDDRKGGRDDEPQAGEGSEEDEFEVNAGEEDVEFESRKGRKGGRRGKEAQGETGEKYRRSEQVELAAEMSQLAAEMSQLVADLGFTETVMKEIRRMAAEDDVYRD